MIENKHPWVVILLLSTGLTFSNSSDITVRYLLFKWLRFSKHQVWTVVLYTIDNGFCSEITDLETAITPNEGLPGLILKPSRESWAFLANNLPDTYYQQIVNRDFRLQRILPREDDRDWLGTALDTIQEFITNNMDYVRKIEQERRQVYATAPKPDSTPDPQRLPFPQPPAAKFRPGKRSLGGLDLLPTKPDIVLAKQGRFHDKYLDLLIARPDLSQQDISLNISDEEQKRFLTSIVQPTMKEPEREQAPTGTYAQSDTATSCTPRIPVTQFQSPSRFRQKKTPVPHRSTETRPHSMNVQRLLAQEGAYARQSGHSHNENRQRVIREEQTLKHRVMSWVRSLKN